MSFFTCFKSPLVFFLYELNLKEKRPGASVHQSLLQPALRVQGNAVRRTQPMTIGQQPMSNCYNGEQQQQHPSFGSRYEPDPILGKTRSVLKQKLDPIRTKKTGSATIQKTKHPLFFS